LARAPAARRLECCGVEWMDFGEAVARASGERIRRCARLAAFLVPRLSVFSVLRPLLVPPLRMGVWLGCRDNNNNKLVLIILRQRGCAYREPNAQRESSGFRSLAKPRIEGQAMWPRQASVTRETALECNSIKKTGQVGADPAWLGGMPVASTSIRERSRAGAREPGRLK
jgi:hypothetical protein